MYKLIINSYDNFETVSLTQILRTNICSLTTSFFLVGVAAGLLARSPVPVDPTLSITMLALAPDTVSPAFSSSPFSFCSSCSFP